MRVSDSAVFIFFWSAALPLVASLGLGGGFCDQGALMVFCFACQFWTCWRLLSLSISLLVVFVGDIMVWVGYVVFSFSLLAGGLCYMVVVGVVVACVGDVFLGASDSAAVMLLWFSALLVSLALLEASVIVDFCVDIVFVAGFMVWVVYVLFSFAHGAGRVCIVLESVLICRC